ncbi:MAG TPA: OmpA family protein, partial [Luteimonas sp.]|nr:OmpA family protein [Luteimonas sp.]
ADSATTEIVTLTDTLGTGLTFGTVTDAGIFTCTGALTCELPAGTLPGTYAVTYTATVNADVTGTVGNSVVATNPPGGDPDPVCTSCTTEHPIEAPVVTVTKTSDPASGSEVRAGDTITYTLTAVVGNSATVQPLVLTDTLGAGLSFGAVLDAGAFACADALICTLPVGTLPGSYAVQYTATVDADAVGSVDNFVTASGGGHEPPDCDSCSTGHRLADPVVTLGKSSNPGSGAQVAVGDTIEYTLSLLVEHAATVYPVRLVDQPSQGLDLGTLPDGCVASGGAITCVLAAGAVPGVYTWTYSATVNASAAGSVSNVVVGTTDGDGQDPRCTTCETTHEVGDAPALRITKAVGSRTVSVGDLVRYTVTVENVGTLNVVDGTLIDTPPAGFSYVEGSMTVADGDGAFTLDGYNPMRIGGLDIAVGRQATIVYLLRVGAGVGHGTHVNTAVAVDGGGDPVSNVATAQVIVDSDPMIDDSLAFGTVFDDRDGDGWQDSAKLTGVRVQGGFSDAGYVAGSTTIDRGNGPVPVADASAPLLHGIDVGDIAGRQSEGDPVEARQVVILQLLRDEPVFDSGFALTSEQGAGLRMAADGTTTPVVEGEAGKGLNAAAPTVIRRVSRVDAGYAVEYVIGNAGIDERGIPGVRIASVEGLLVETDQFGRYHIADVHGGDWARGRNFILKVDPATLPAGAEFTTDNPLLRRVTPGIPVRFDFGVQLPVQVIEGGRRVLELELGEVLFAPESSEVRAEYLPAIGRMAAKVNEHGGGEVVVTATATREALAFARAEAVRDALSARVDAAAKPAVSVVLRTEAEDPHSMLAGLHGSELLLGTVLFDTDRAAIRPEFESLLDAVAARIERMGGGAISIVGHTDVRASHAYNAALGLRRAQAVFDAIAKRLGPAARANLKVDASPDPAAPVGGAGK